jgi:hypothetical protein
VARSARTSGRVCPSGCRLAFGETSVTKQVVPVQAAVAPPALSFLCEPSRRAHELGLSPLGARDPVLLVAWVPVERHGVVAVHLARIALDTAPSGAPARRCLRELAICAACEHRLPIDGARVGACLRARVARRTERGVAPHVAPALHLTSFRPAARAPQSEPALLADERRGAVRRARVVHRRTPRARVPLGSYRVVAVERAARPARTTSCAPARHRGPCEPSAPAARRLAHERRRWGLAHELVRHAARRARRGPRTTRGGRHEDGRREEGPRPGPQP